MANKRITDLTNEGTQSDSLYVEVDSATYGATRKQTVGVLLSGEVTARAAQDDVIEAGAGLDAAGTYTADATTNYLTAALFAAAGKTANLKNADWLLDAQIKVLANLVAGFDTITQDTIKVSTAAVKLLNTNPVSLLAAPGTGKVINVLKVVFWLDYSTAAFDNGAAVVLQYTTSNKQILASSAGMLAKVADYYEQAEPDDASEVSVNDGIELTCSSNGTVGGGSLYINILYTVTDFSAYRNA